MEDLEQLKILENGYRMKVGGSWQHAVPAARAQPPSLLPFGAGVEGRSLHPAPATCSLVASQSFPHSKRSFPVPQVVVVDHSAHGVDLPEDVASIEAIMGQQRLQ